MPVCASDGVRGGEAVPTMRATLAFTLLISGAAAGAAPQAAPGPAAEGAPTAVAILRTTDLDRATFLVRKVQGTRTFDTYTSESTTTYAPEVDVEIPPAQLAFGAPEGGETPRP